MSGLAVASRLNSLARGARSRVLAANPVARRKAERAAFWKNFRQIGWRIVDDIGYSPHGTLVCSFVMATIVAATFAFLASTVHHVAVAWHHELFVAEAVFTGIFVVEYVARLLLTPDTLLDHICRPMNVIDLLSVLPLFVELAFTPDGQGMDMLLGLRAPRLIRLFKLGRYSDDLLLFAEGAVRTTKSCSLLVALLAVAVLLFSSLMYLAERGDIWDSEQRCWKRDGEVHFSGCSPFESVPLTFWWAVTTISTVGYGDSFPITAWGKFVAAGAMVMGLLAIALPTTILSIEFAEQYQSRIDELQETKRRRCQMDLTPAQAELTLLSRRYVKKREKQLQDMVKYQRLLHVKGVVDLEPSLDQLLNQHATHCDSVRKLANVVADKR